MRGVRRMVDAFEDVPLIAPPPAKSREEIPDNPFELVTRVLTQMPYLKLENRARDGAILTFWVGREEDARSILQDKQGIWLKGPQTGEPFKSIVPMHMIAVEGDQHKRLRMTGQRVLNEQVRDRLLVIAFEQAERLATKLRLEAAKPFIMTDIDRRIRSCALDIISCGIFGTSWNAIDDYSESNPKAWALAQLMYVLHWRVTDLSERGWRKEPWGSGDAKPHLDVLVPFIQDEIRKKRRAPEGDDCMLAEWIRDNPDLSDFELENLSMTFLTMGHENVATAISWTLIQLAENLDAQALVREQVLASGVTAKPPSSVQWKDLSKLGLVEHAFLESSRLFPSVPVVSRVASRDTQVGSITVPANTEVVVNLYGLNRNKAVYRDANKFACPHRAIQADHYYSFGGGSRMCVGRPLSNVESKAIVTTILANFHLESASSKPTKPRNYVSFRPGDHAIRLTLLPKPAL